MQTTLTYAKNLSCSPSSTLEFLTQHNKSYVHTDQSSQYNYYTAAYSQLLSAHACDIILD